MCSIASAASDLLSWRSWTSFCFTACCKATSSARKSPPLKWINLSPQAVHRQWAIPTDLMLLCINVHLNNQNGLYVCDSIMKQLNVWIPFMIIYIYKWMLWLGLIVIELTHDYLYRIPFITVLWTGYLMLSNISVFCLIHLLCW